MRASQGIGSAGGARWLAAPCATPRLRARRLLGDGHTQREERVPGQSCVWNSDNLGAHATLSRVALCRQTAQARAGNRRGSRGALANLYERRVESSGYTVVLPVT